jgi:hypothetical protein
VNGYSRIKAAGSHGGCDSRRRRVASPTGPAAPACMRREV